MNDIPTAVWLLAAYLLGFWLRGYISPKPKIYIHINYSPSKDQE